MEKIFLLVSFLLGFYMNNTEEFVKSEKLRTFLMGFRFITLLFPIVFSWLMLDREGGFTSIVPNITGNMKIAIILLLFVYHIVACIWMMNFYTDKTKIRLLVISDVILGMTSIILLGTPYIFVGIVLPALESKCFLENIWANSILGLCGIIFLVILLGELAKINNINVGMDETQKTFTVKEITLNIWGTAQFFLVFIIPMIWAYDVAVKIENEKNQIILKAQDAKKMIIEDTAKDKLTMQQLMNALNEKDNEIENYREQIVRFKDEADQNYRKYNEQKNQFATQNENFRAKENELTTSFDNQLKKIQQDNAELAMNLKKAENLISVTVDLNKSLNLQEAYVSVVEHLIKLVPVQTCILFMLDTVDKRTEIFAEMVYSPYSEYFKNFSVKIGYGIVGIAAEMQRILRIDNSIIEIDGKEYRGLLDDERSALIVPISYEEELLGLFYLGKEEVSAFDEETTELVKSYADISAVTLQNAQLFQKTISGGMFDDLTGFYNAVYFNERFGEEINRSKTYRIELGIVLVEIDNFVPLTDEFGSNWSEDVLKEVSEVIREQVRDTDITARIQAGQFVIILLQSDRRNSYIIAEKIRASFERKNMTRMRRSRASTTISVGVSMFPQDAQDKTSLISSVEAALNVSKTHGGNKTFITGMRV